MVLKMDIPGLDQPADLIGSPMKFSKTKVNYRMPPPALGEHTDQVLREFGFSAKDIEDLKEAKAV